METITLNFRNSEDIIILKQIIEELGLEVSFGESEKMTIPDDVLETAKQNYKDIEQGKRLTKSWEQVKKEILAKNA